MQAHTIKEKYYQRKNKKMEIKVDNGACIVNIKIHEDATINEAVEIVAGALLQQGYSQQVIVSGFKKFIEDI